jgi:dihydroxyacetone kinase DhaKLM complex PTS-EIIA-like component DhaM
MKLTQQQITRVEQILSDLERKIEEMEQQDYITYDLGKDLQNISFMIDMLREEIENE